MTSGMLTATVACEAAQMVHWKKKEEGSPGVAMCFYKQETFNSHLCLKSRTPVLLYVYEAERGAHTPLHLDAKGNSRFDLLRCEIWGVIWVNIAWACKRLWSVFQKSLWCNLRQREHVCWNPPPRLSHAKYVLGTPNIVLLTMLN